MYNNNEFFPHINQVNLRKWQFKNFSPLELASKGDDSFKLDVEAVTKLQTLRNKINKPLIITSAYRDPIHNYNIGGSVNSKHLLGKAFDISLDNHDKFELAKIAKQVGFTGVGYYSSFIHVDTCKKREWGSW